MTDVPSATMTEALAMVAPGRPLRDGIERVLQAKRGALVVIGDGPGVLAVCTGGFLLDSEFSPQRLSELAKMDGAIILSADAGRIARANVHLMPHASVPTTETGTRHRTAERVARSLDVPVISVSAAMSRITVYRHDERYVLRSTARMQERVSQALQALHRFRTRFDSALSALSVLEIGDRVTLSDVVALLQPAESVGRIAAEVRVQLIELGEDGRMLGLQLDELTDGVAEAEWLVVRDYLRPPAGTSPHQTADGTARDVPDPVPPAKVDAALAALGALGEDDLLDPRKVAAALGYPAHQVDLDETTAPRGYRQLHRLPRFPELVLDGIVSQFPGLRAIMGASARELERVTGVGEARARAVRDGLARLAETTVAERNS